MQSGKMLGIIDARRKNTRNRQCTQKKYSESSMQGTRMLGNDKVCWKMDGIVKARWKNARISSMYAGKNTRSRKCTQEKYSESSMQGVRMLGNDKVCWKNTRIRQCKLRKCSESSMQGARMLGNDKVCWKILGFVNASWEKVLGIVNARCKNAGKRQSMLKNGRNRQSKVKECPDIVNVRRKKYSKS